MTPYPTHAGPVPAYHPSLPEHSRPPACPMAHAALLDTLAGVELQHGHADAAERLAWQAAAMRETAQSEPTHPNGGRA